MTLENDAPLVDDQSESTLDKPGLNKARQRQSAMNDVNGTLFIAILAMRTKCAKISSNALKPWA